MLNVFICDDDSIQCEQIKDIVTKHILIENLDMHLAFVTGNPADMLDYLDRHPNDNTCSEYGLYFLDIDFRHELNGIQLASKILEREPIAYIVFITSHAELSHLTFRYKVGALDYITKDFPEEIISRVKACIDTAYTRHLAVNVSSKTSGFPLPIGNRIRIIPFSEIMFFEAHPSLSHRLILHMSNSQIEFRGTLNRVASVVPDFWNCHKSCLVNLRNIQHVDKSRRVAVMQNGESVPIAMRKLREFSSLFQNLI